ncbi:tetratricopeptide repeat protein [Planctomycetales bacterium ZRK34]|nr:tetratricopeptide repeat protein [Planctomycetales bacterium ZRK34]
MNRTLLTTGLAIVLVLGLGRMWIESAESAGTARSLAERVTELEKRVEALEQQVKPVASEARIEQAKREARLAARRRMQQDLQTHTREQLADAEQLYQKANKNLRSPDAVNILEQMIKQYPGCNRTGCAVMYLGQMSKGEVREKYLTMAAEKFADCYYGDGVQVGAYALWYLAHDALRQHPDEAKALFAKLIDKYPDAIDHKGNLLADRLPIDLDE